VVHTGICQGNRLGVDVTEGAADRGDTKQRDGAHGTDDQGVENSGLLVGGPADVAEGSRPELRGRHGCRKRSDVDDRSGIFSRLKSEVNA
jgi:hypothetical protein